MYVQTVLGSLSLEDLGITYCHEHLLCDQRLGSKVELYGANLIEEDYMVLENELTAQENLLLLKSSKVSTIVEVTVDGWGRNVEALYRLSKNTGINIICSTGFYIEGCHPSYVSSCSVDELTNIMLKEIKEGIGPNNVKPGVIKWGCSKPVIEGEEEKSLQAVIAAHLETGLPIITHSSGEIRWELPSGNLALTFLDYMAKYKVNLSKVILSHCDLLGDIEEWFEIAEKGATVGVDLIGKEEFLLDKTRALLIGKMVEKGYENNIVLATDRCRKRHLSQYGGTGYQYLINVFVPMLIGKGLGNYIDCFLVANPKRILASG